MKQQAPLYSAASVCLPLVEIIEGSRYNRETTGLDTCTQTILTRFGSNQDYSPLNHSNSFKPIDRGISASSEFRLLSTEMVDLGPNWVRLTSKWDKSGTFSGGVPNCTEI